MTFNPLNFQLKRETEGIVRRQNHIQLKQSMNFGRSSKCDFKLFGRKCSKEQCKIAFRDGVPLLTDFSTNGTFVNRVQVERNTETALVEHDQILFGVSPVQADIKNRDTYVFTVTRPDFVDLIDSDDDEIQVVEDVTDSGNEPSGVKKPKITTSERQGDEIDYSDNSNVSTHPSKENEETSNEEMSGGEREAPEAEEESCLAQASQSLPTVGPSLTGEEIRQRQHDLRHWNTFNTQIIDALPLNHDRKRKLNKVGASKEKKPKTATKRDRKERLRAIVTPEEPAENKVVETKPLRDVKIKITKDNRGGFLCLLPDDRPVPACKKTLNKLLF